MVTILLVVSRPTWLERVISAIELIDCNKDDTNILCIVDGDEALYVKTRNLINGTKFRERLTVQLDYPGKPPRLDVWERRKRITAAHNQARELITPQTEYIFSVEDDTLFRPDALKRCMKVIDGSRAIAAVQGVELGRWGIPYVGAWIADDIYDPKVITSVENKIDIEPNEPPMRIDAGGLYCVLIRADLYKQHVFTCANGLGPDVNFGMENRQLGFENYLLWNVPCTHLYEKMGNQYEITPRDKSKQVVLTQLKPNKWHVKS